MLVIVALLPMCGALSFPSTLGAESNCSWSDEEDSYFRRLVGGYRTERSDAVNNESSAFWDKHRQRWSLRMLNPGHGTTATHYNHNIMCASEKPAVPKSSTNLDPAMVLNNSLLIKKK